MTRVKGHVAPGKNYKLTTFEDLCADAYYHATDELWVTPDGDVRKVKVWEDKVYYKDLNQTLSNAKYWQVGNVKGAIPVHVLVALAFIGPRPDGYDVNHIDRDHDNNFVLNLEYLEKSKNRSPKYFCKQ